VSGPYLKQSTLKLMYTFPFLDRSYVIIIFRCNNLTYGQISFQIKTRTNLFITYLYCQLLKCDFSRTTNRKSYFTNPPESKKRKLITSQMQANFKNKQLACVEYDDLTPELERDIFQVGSLSFIIPPNLIIGHVIAACSVWRPSRACRSVTSFDLKYSE